MRRFDFAQKKHLKSTIVLLVVALVVLFYFIFTVGFKMLLNTSAFIANTFSEATPVPLNRNSDIYGSINIDDIPIATNSAKIIVSGSVINYGTLNFYINDELVKKQPITSTDIFNIEIGDLERGDNEVYVKALTDDGKNSKKTTVYTVVYKDEKPKLDISDPDENSTTSNPEVTVKGATDREVLVKINDSPVVVDVNGNFDSTVRLKEGENKITVTAQDTAGNLETKTLAVTYRKDD